MKTTLNEVREFTSIAPKYISRWGRSDSIYGWIGCIVRLKRKFWKEVSEPYGLVIEVGPASWMVALWEDGRSPADNHVCRLDVDVWWPKGIHSLKEGILARRFSETDLSRFLSTIDPNQLIKKR